MAGNMDRRAGYRVEIRIRASFFLRSDGMLAALAVS